MQISFDPVNLSAEEREILLAVLDVSPAAPAAKATPAKAAAKPAAAKKEPQPEPPEEEEDLLGGGDDSEVTMEDAVAAATKLVSEGQAADVKAALAKVGAKRVSEVKAADLAKFVGLLNK